MQQASEAADRTIVRLSKKLSVEITVGAAHVVCEWHPKKPSKLTAKELRRYRAARDEMLQRLGRASAVLEI